MPTLRSPLRTSGTSPQPEQKDRIPPPSASSSGGRVLISTPAWVVLLAAARAVGKLIALLTSAFVLNALLLGAIIAVLAALDIASVGKSDHADHWLTANRVLAIWALALIAWWVLRQRRRLLIARFDDLSGDKGGTPGAATGMSILLASELVQLRDLFQEFEEGSAIQSTADDTRSTRLGTGRSELFEAAIQVDAQGGFLESAVSAESTLGVGPLKIPINILLGLVNRLVQGPRLSGQVQSDGGRRIVTIDLIAGRLQGQWRVEDAPNAPPRSSTDLARELAIRIFADLAFERSARWTAVASLIEGLRAYRRTLRTTKERRLNLLAAERCLLDTITEDNRFDLAHYNLGVVYAALDRTPAARSAFTRSIELNPQRFDSQYALARVLYVGAAGKNSAAVVTELRLALDHCERALSLAGDAEARAKVLNQKAVVQIGLKGLDFFFAARSCRAAVRAALQASLAAELAVDRRSGLAARRRMQARALASSSLQQLVSILRQTRTLLRHTPRARRLRAVEWSARRQTLSAARLAAWLTPNDVDAQLVLGVCWLERAQPRRAIGPLNRAAQLAPERGNAWCSLALGSAMVYWLDQFGAAYGKAMDAIGATADTFLPDLAQALKILAARTRYLRMRVSRFARKVASRKGGRATTQDVLRAIGFQYSMAWFLSGRRLRRWAGSMYDLQTPLQQRDQWIAQLSAQIGWQRAEAARIRRLPQRRAEVDALVRDPKDRSVDLGLHYKEAVERQWAWEAGDAATALGRVAMRFGRAGEARRHFEAAIELLAPVHPAEIERRALHARLARALSAVGEPGAALDAALRAVEIDPVSNYERDSLADCHFELREWASARAQWEESLRLAPDDPVTYHNIALCCYNEGGSADKPGERRAWFTHAADSLERALSLFPSHDQRRLDSQFLLGRIKITLGDVHGGQALWRALESRGFRPLYLGLHLADSMLREVSLELAQAMFVRWSKHIATEVKADPEIMSRPVDGLPGDPSQTTYGESLVWAELGIAAAIARRHGGFDEALVHTGMARAAGEEIKEETTRLEWLGNCDRIEGEILLRQGAPARAVPLLERALLRTTNAEAYRYLAAALLDQLEPSAAVDAGARAAAMRIKALLDHASKLDLDEEIEQPIAELRGQLGNTAAGKAIAWSAT